MKRFAAGACLLLSLVVATYAFAENGTATLPKPSTKTSAIPRVDPTDIPPPAGKPAGTPRQVSETGGKYTKMLMDRPSGPFGAKGFDLKALRSGMGTRRIPKTPGLTIRQIKVGDIPCDWVYAEGADPNVRLLYIHGGGFVSGGPGHYLPLAGHLSEVAKCVVLLPDYRLAPEHPFPAAIDDCVAAHEWLRQNGPAGHAAAKATFVAGDSAGGSLTLATLLALRDRKLPLPAGGMPLSATADLTLASESINGVHDPIISSKTMPIFREMYLGKQDPRNPLASPVFADYHGIPPMLIQAGEHEMLRDDSVRVAKKARADGVRVTLEIWPGMFHVFQSHEPLLPEAKEAIDHMAEFMRACMAKRFSNNGKQQ